MIITLEGVDGAGKSTQASMLVEWIASKGYEAQLFKFPDYSTPVGRRILEYLQSGIADAKKFHALMAENRREKVDHILQAMAHTHIIVIDRYVESNLAYGAANGLDREWLEGLDAEMPRADAVILLDVDISESFRRQKNRDRFESDRAFLERVAAEYRSQARTDTDGRWHSVAAGGDVDRVHDQVAACARDIIKTVASRGV